MILWQLFLAFLKIGAFSFGGGYAAMPLIQSEVIDTYGWLTQEDFSDLLAIAEMTPGPIAVNAATFVGTQIAGIPGALCATLGVILPSCVFVTILASFYQKYRSLQVMKSILAALRPAVVAAILAAGLTIMISSFFRDGTFSFLAGNFQWRMAVYFAAALFVLRRFRKVSPILVMAGCGVAELVVQLIQAA